VIQEIKGNRKTVGVGMKALGLLFVLSCFFPYIDVVRMGTDTQPNALVTGGLLLFAIRNKKINAPIILLWTLFIISTFLIFYNNLSFFFYLKNTFNYLSPALVATATYILLSRMKFVLSFRLFLSMMLIYALVGLMQLYLVPDFLNFLVNGAGRGTLVGGRGVVSLFAEPAFYGSSCMFFMCFSLMQYSRKQNYIVMSLLIFQLVFLSRSATAIAIFLCAIGFFTLVQLLRFRLRYVIGAAVGILLSSMVITHYWSKIESTRAGELAAVFVENPLLITQIDGSVGIRFTGTMAPFLSMRHHYMKPQGLGYYIEFLTEFRSKGLYRNFLTINNTESKPRLSGSLNMVLYQLGFLGLLFPLAIYLAFRGQLREDAVLFAFILFLVTLMTQIQLMNGMIGFIIGTAIYRGKMVSAEKKQRLIVDN